jgi:hypothetical protein
LATVRRQGKLLEQWRRIARDARILSPLAKLVFTLLTSLAILLAVAFGSGQVQISSGGIELRPRGASGAAEVDSSVASPSGHGALYVILAPRTVTVCQP